VLKGIIFMYVSNVQTFLVRCLMNFTKGAIRKQEKTYLG